MNTHPVLSCQESVKLLIMAYHLSLKKKKVRVTHNSLGNLNTNGSLIFSLHGSIENLMKAINSLWGKM